MLCCINGNEVIWNSKAYFSKLLTCLTILQHKTVTVKTKFNILIRQDIFLHTFKNAHVKKYVSDLLALNLKNPAYEA